MEDTHLIGNPRYRALCRKPYGKAQGMTDQVKGTKTIFFIYKADIPEDCCKDLTY